MGEPGEANILKQQPRPKEEPIVLAWMWLSIVANGALLSLIIIVLFIFSLLHYTDNILQIDIIKLDDAETKLMKARTVAFISLVFCENVRAYTSRSFDKPMWVGLCTNREMQKAIVLAQLCLYVAVFCPGLSDMVLKLDGTAIGLWGWIVALAGPVATVILCEAFKVVTYFQMLAYQRKLQAETEAKARRNEQEVFKQVVVKPNETAAAKTDPGNVLAV